MKEESDRKLTLQREGVFITLDCALYKEMIFYKGVKERAYA